MIFISKKEQEFKFIVDVPPDEYCINNFHKTIARGLIEKYGAENMRRVLKEIERMKNTSDK